MRHIPAQTGLVHFDPHDGLRKDMRRDAATGGFNFRKFGHGG